MAFITVPEEKCIESLPNVVKVFGGLLLNLKEAH